MHCAGCLTGVTEDRSDRWAVWGAGTVPIKKADVCLLNVPSVHGHADECTGNTLSQQKLERNQPFVLFFVSLARLNFSCSFSLYPPVTCIRFLICVIIVSLTFNVLHTLLLWSFLGARLVFLPRPEPR